MNQLKNRVFLIIAIISYLTLTSMANAADAAAGKAKSGICAACHGIDGISPNPIWPNIKGQKALYIIKQLKAFKSGARKDPLMQAQAMSLTDSDMENLATYYATLK